MANADLQRYLSGIPTDTSSMTEQQLTDKLKGLQDLIHQNAGFDPSAFTGTYQTTLVNSYGLRPETAKQVAPIVSNFIAAQGRYPTAQEFEGLIPKMWPFVSPNGGLLPELHNAIFDEKLRNTTSSSLTGGNFDQITPEINQRMSDLQSVLNQKTAKRTQDEGVTSYLNDLPNQQNKIISDYESSLQTSQGNFFNDEITPSILQNLNARGIINSGDLTSSLAQAGGRLQQGIQNTIAPLRAQFATDTQNKTYENLLRGALEQGQSLNSAIDFTRNMFTQNQQNLFTANQADLNRQNQSDIANKSVALQLALMGKGQQNPSPLDYFLQYGLPTVGALTGNYLSGVGVGQGLAKK